MAAATKEWFDLTSIICSRFGTNSCNPISAKIASSMIRVAATRIFADPTQSILEIPVNSIDSYRRQRSAGKQIPSIGKFGMGFFSFLYWLIGHPDRYLRLYSVHGSDRWNLEIREIDGVLAGSFLEEPPSSFQHGTIVSLYSPSSALPSTEFTDQIHRLSFIPDVIWNINQSSIPADIHISLDDHHITISDQAEGISRATLFGSLLVPSISTKTLNQTFALTPFVNASRVFSSVIWNGLIITVGDIVVVSNPSSELALTYIITLPLETPLPVSREDILIRDLRTETLLIDSCLQIIDECIAIGSNLDYFFRALREYADYSQQPPIYRIIQTVKEQVLARTDILFLPNAILANVLRPLISVPVTYLPEVSTVTATRQLRSILTSFMIESIFEGIDVVVLPDKFNSLRAPMTAGIGAYLFLSESMVAMPGWATTIAASFPSLILKSSISISSRSIPTEFWDALQAKFPSTFATTLPFLQTILPELDILLATIEAKLKGWSNEIIILTYSKLDNPAHRILFECVVAMHLLINVMVKIHSDSTMISNTLREYAAQIRLLIVEYKIEVPYGGNIKWIFVGYQEQIPVPESLDRHGSASTINIFFECVRTFREANPRNVSLTYDHFFPEIRLDVSSELIPFQQSILTAVNNQMINGFEGTVVLRILNLWKRNYPASTTPPEIIYSPDSVRYLFVELRNRYSFQFMTEWRRKTTESSLYYKSVVLDPMVLAFELRLRSWMSIGSSDGTCSPFSPPASGIGFTANQLIDYVFTHPISTEEPILELVPAIAQHYVDPNRPQFQSVQIAVNEGTTKPFIPSVLSELVQNSIDAIQGSLVSIDRQHIDITLCDTEYSFDLIFRDYIGIPNAAWLSLWIPFLSSKSVDDLMSTGEMGTGFFNVYRQPWVKDVLIRSGKIQVYVVPLLGAHNRVLDIQYQVNSISNFVGTEIRIRLRDLSPEEIIDLKVDLYVYVYSTLPFIPYPIAINGASVQTETQVLLQSEVGTVSIITGRDAPSLLMTNGVPLNGLVSYLESMLGGIEPAITMGCIINLNPGYYQPVQSRNRVRKMEDASLASILKSFLEQAVYRLILFKLSSEIRPDLGLEARQLPQADVRDAPLNQFAFYSGGRTSIYGKESGPTFGNYPGIRFLPGSSDIRFPGSTVGQNITFLQILNAVINEYIFGTEKPEVSFETTERFLTSFLSVLDADSEVKREIGTLVHRWVDRKNNEFLLHRSSNLEDVAALIASLNPMREVLQLFARLYYEIGSTLNITIGVDFEVAPAVIFDDLFEFVAGVYERSYRKFNHTIVLNAESAQRVQTKFLEGIREFQDRYQVDPIDAAAFFRLQDNIRFIVGNIYPSPTIVHELLHALHRSNHQSNDAHGFRDYVIDGILETLNFEDACTRIYTLILEHGFLDRFAVELGNLPLA